MDGILIINKEKGYTSHDVVACLRGILHQKKIGHTGTLDPNAEGVLPVCLGRATKVCELLTDTDKTYEAVLRLGVVTDTQDLTGRVLAQSDAVPGEEEVVSAIRSFEGELEQIPPMYSAIKIGGRKLVDLARAGKEVERPARRVTVYRIRILEMDLPRVRMEVSCSKGTYIRTLCHDIGQKLGCGGAMEALVRTRAAGFGREEALTLGKVEALAAAGELESRLVPLERIFADLPRFQIAAEHAKALQNGNRLKLSWGVCRGEASGRMAVYDEDGRFAAVYERMPGTEELKVVKMF